MKRIVQVCATDLTFNDEGLATLYRAYSWHGVDISMNPQLRFGEPVIDSCRYSVQALIDACIAEGSYEAAAEAYGVRREEVEAAFRYHDYLGDASS